MWTSQLVNKRIVYPCGSELEGVVGDENKKAVANHLPHFRAAFCCLLFTEHGFNLLRTYESNTQQVLKEKSTKLFP